MGLWEAFRPSSESHTTGSICSFLKRENKYVGLGKVNQHLILHFTVLGLWCQLKLSLFKEVYPLFFFPRPTLRRLRPEDMFETWVRKWQTLSAL